MVSLLQVSLTCAQSKIEIGEIIYSDSVSMGGSPGDVDEVPVTWVKQRKCCRMSCDVGEATEGLENELLRR